MRLPSPRPLRPEKVAAQHQAGTAAGIGVPMFRGETDGFFEVGQGELGRMATR